MPILCTERVATNVGRQASGRVGVFELFNVNEELNPWFMNKPASLPCKKAREMGMRSMREDGIRKVLAGVTTPEEVLHATVVDSIYKGRRLK